MVEKKYLYIKRNVGEEFDYYKMYYDMIKHFNINVEELSINEVEIKSIHVTTGNDDGKSIKKSGIFNLQKALVEGTPIHKFLLDREIKIDINNRLINYRGKDLEIRDDSINFNGEESFVYHKLYKDYLINGFHCVEKPLEYGGRVTYRPEFIYSLGIFLGYNELQYEWKNEFNQCYIVEYKANPYKYEWFNYQIDNMTQHEFEENKEKYIKKWLIIQAINVISYDVLEWGKPEIFSYMGFENNVPSSDIIKVIDVTKERE